MKWYWESAVTAGMCTVLVVFILLVLNAGSSGESKKRQVIVDLREGESVVGAAELRCEDLVFRATEFNIGSRSGRVVVDTGSCVLVKKNVTGK